MSETADQVAELRSMGCELAHLNQALEHTEEQIVQGEKLAAICYLAHGIAHELNTPAGCHEAIALLRAAPDIDAGLMDIMMPEMDGFEVIRRLTAEPQFAALPTIAVTAEVMQPDRYQCIGAGQSDSITKPIDVNHLVSLLRVWLTRR